MSNLYTIYEITEVSQYKVTTASG